MKVKVRVKAPGRLLPHHHHQRNRKAPEIVVLHAHGLDNSRQFFALQQQSSPASPACDASDRSGFLPAIWRETARTRRSSRFQSRFVFLRWFLPPATCNTGTSRAHGRIRVPFRPAGAPLAGRKSVHGDGAWSRRSLRRRFQRCAHKQYRDSRIAAPCARATSRRPSPNGWQSLPTAADCDPNGRGRRRTTHGCPRLRKGLNAGSNGGLSGLNAVKSLA